MTDNREIECVILPQFASNILLPRASVVDVIDGENMDIVVDLQGGVIGKVNWRGWTVPLISFESAISGEIPKFNNHTQTVIIHALTDDLARPYIGLTAQGNPKAMPLNDDHLHLLDTMDDNDFVKSKVWINSEIEALIPDLPVLVSYSSQFI